MSSRILEKVFVPSQERSMARIVPLAVLVALCAAALAPVACAQEDQDDQARAALRRRILARVDQVLAEEMARIRSEVAEMLDQELELAEGKRTAEHPAAKGDAHPEHPQRRETRPARKEPRPETAPEVDEDDIDLSPGDRMTDMMAEMSELGSLFEESMEHHTSGRYDESIAGFRKIAERTSDPSMVATARYNVACGYALKGDKKQALAWLKRAIRSGFTDVDHMQNDPDLASIRDDEGFRALVEEARKAEGAEGEE